MAKKAAATGKPMSKTEVLNTLAEKTELSKKDVQAVFDELAELISDELGKKGPGVFSVPGLMKIKAVHKPATPARKGINPFTKEEQMFKAKPASTRLRITALKKLKDMV